jgi:hypothetical protein
MQSKKDIPDCFGEVKQTINIPMSIAVHKSIQNARNRRARECRIGQESSILEKNNRDYA